MSSPRRDLVILGAASVLLTLLFFSPTDNWRWDPSFYYAQLRSPIIDQDLDFRDETIPRDGVSRRTVTGLQPSPWPIGPSLLWGPFFLAAHVYVAVRPGISAENGFATPYIAAVAAGSALYGLLGVWVTYRAGRFFGSKPLAMVTTLMVLLATPLFFYVFRQPFMAHSTSFLASASLLLACLMAGNGSLKQAHTGLAIGVCIGLCVLARWTSVLLALIPFMLFVTHLDQALRARNTEQVKADLAQFCYAGLAALVVVSPQLALWYKLHNTWLVFPSQGFSASLLPTNLLDLFVHTNRGILFWAPFTVVGLLGLLWVRPLRLRVALVIYMLAHLYVLGLWNDWYGGGGYGPRYFIETLPVLAVGFISLTRGIWRRWGGKYLVTGFAISVVVHQLLLLTIVEQAWLPLPDYFGGKPLGLSFQLDGFRRLLSQPSDFLLPRINVASERQSAAVNLFAGHTDPSLYYMPLAALIVIPAGLLLYGYLEKFPKARFLSYAVIVYMLGWFGFLLSIET